MPRKKDSVFTKNKYLPLSSLTPQEEVNSFYIQAKLNLKLYEKKTKEREDWEKYLQCSTKPDVTKEADITTYISQYKETNKLANCSLGDTIAGCQYTEDVSS